MSISSEISVSQSEGVPSGLPDGFSSDTFSFENGFNSLDVFNLGSLGIFDEADDEEDESRFCSVVCVGIGMSVASFESHSDNGGVDSRPMQDTYRCGDNMLRLNGESDDSLGLLSISSTSSCQTQIVYRPPVRNTSLHPPHTSSDLIETPGPSADKQVSIVDHSPRQHINQRMRMKNRIFLFFEKAWTAIKCCETSVEPFVPLPAKPETSCTADSSGLKPTGGGFNTVRVETATPDGKKTEDPDCLDECDTSENYFDEPVINRGSFAAQRGKPDHRLDEWSFNSKIFIGEGGSDDSLALLSINSGASSSDGQNVTWENVPGPHV